MYFCIHSSKTGRFVKRALTQKFTKVDENLLCEFSRQVGTSYVTIKNQLFTHEIYN